MLSFQPIIRIFRSFSWARKLEISPRKVVKATDMLCLFRVDSSVNIPLHRGYKHGIFMGYEWFFLVDMNGIFMANPIQKSLQKKPFLYPRYPVHFIEEISQQNQHDVRGLRCRCSKDVAADSADVLGTWSRFGWKKLEDSQLDLKHPKSLGWRFFEVIMFMILIRFRYD